MRRFALLFGAVLMTALVAADAGALALGDGMPSAGVKMRGVDGTDVSIADVKGRRGTLVIFSCNACPWVKAWEERMVALGNEVVGRGIGVIVINSNDPAQVAEDDYPVMQQRAREKGYKVPYVVDATSQVARAFGATRTPEAFLFDAGGRLVYHGAIDDNAHEPEKVERRFLKDAVDSVIAGREVPVKETKALGCTIKWRS